MKRELTLFVLVWAMLLAGVGIYPDDTIEKPDARQIQMAVDEGLKWLAENQVADGPDKGCWKVPKYRPAITSLAGLAFLANGYVPGKGAYGVVIDNAMAYVKKQMTPDGYLGGHYDNGMYMHAMCSLFALSYLGQKADPEKEKELAEWCQKSVDLILEAQKISKSSYARGGWRYLPYDRESDLSVSSWQLLVLHAARQCGYAIDALVFENAMRYVNSSFFEDDKEGKAGFVYRPGVTKKVKPSVTGVAVFVKHLLEREADQRSEKALKYLKKFRPSWGGPQYNGYFFLGSFYMSQGMFQIGGEVWEDFGPKIQRILLDHQKEDGRWDFTPDSVPQSRDAGIAYPTAMSILILSLEKQYLPMYQRQKQLF